MDCGDARQRIVRSRSRQFSWCTEPNLQQDSGSDRRAVESRGLGSPLPNRFASSRDQLARAADVHRVLESSLELDDRLGEEDPLGRHVRATKPEGVFRVIGTVPYVYARGPEEAYHPSAYFPLRPSTTRDFAGLFVKTSRSPEQMVSAINEALKPVAPLTKDPFVFVADEALGRITATRRFNAGLMSAFGLVGFLIGAAGVYAVMASFVAQQTREIGVRLALGATPSRIQRGVLALAWRHLAAGLALGLPIAWWSSQGFSALLFQVTPADASVYVGVTAMLSVVGLMAAWIPARRAAGVDPVISLRR
jgi:putative ABC transport system permease protein